MYAGVICNKSLRKKIRVPIENIADPSQTQRKRKKKKEKKKKNAHLGGEALDVLAGLVKRVRHYQNFGVGMGVLAAVGIGAKRPVSG
jgi:hypothetical protein